MDVLINEIGELEREQAEKEEFVRRVEKYAAGSCLCACKGLVALCARPGAGEAMSDLAGAALESWMVRWVVEEGAAKHGGHMARSVREECLRSYAVVWGAPTDVGDRTHVGPMPQAGEAQKASPPGTGGTPRVGGEAQKVWLLGVLESDCAGRVRGEAAAALAELYGVEDGSVGTAVKRALADEDTEASLRAGR